MFWLRNKKVKVSRSSKVAVIDKEPHLFHLCKTSILFASLVVQNCVITISLLYQPVLYRHSKVLSLLKQGKLWKRLSVCCKSMK